MESEPSHDETGGVAERAIPSKRRRRIRHRAIAFLRSPYFVGVLIAALFPLMVVPQALIQGDAVGPLLLEVYRNALIIYLTFGLLYVAGTSRAGQSLAASVKGLRAYQFLQRVMREDEPADERDRPPTEMTRSKWVSSVFSQAQSVRDRLRRRRRLHRSLVIALPVAMLGSVALPVGLAFYAAVYWEGGLLLPIFAAINPMWNSESADRDKNVAGLAFVGLAIPYGAFIVSGLAMKVFGENFAPSLGVQLWCAPVLALYALPYFERATLRLKWHLSRNGTLATRIADAISGGTVAFNLAVGTFIALIPAALLVTLIFVTPASGRAQDSPSGVERFRRSSDLVFPVLIVSQDEVASTSHGSMVLVRKGAAAHLSTSESAPYDRANEAWFVVVLDGRADIVKLSLSNLQRASPSVSEPIQGAWELLQEALHPRTFMETALVALGIGILLAAAAQYFSGLSRLTSLALDWLVTVIWTLIRSPMRHADDAMLLFLLPVLLLDLGTGAVGVAAGEFLVRAIVGRAKSLLKAGHQP